MRQDSLTVSIECASVATRVDNRLASLVGESFGRLAESGGLPCRSGFGVRCAQR